MNKKWNKKEEDFLIKNHKKMISKEIGSYLSRSVLSIQMKARKIGIRVRREILKSDYHDLEGLELKKYIWEKRILGKLIKKKSGCWEIPWSNKKKYGNINIYSKNIRRRSVSMHRIAYEVFNNKEIDSNTCILHKCDNRCCNNPYHLFAGTKKDNFYDMIFKNREGHVFNSNNSSGVNNIKAKLSEQDVKNIRMLFSSKTKTKDELAKQYMVTRENIFSIVTYKTWKNL